MTRKTQITLSLLDDAYRADRDMAAACDRMISTRKATGRRARSSARKAFGPLAVSWTKRADRCVSDTRVIRDLAKAHGWDLG